MKLGDKVKVILLNNGGYVKLEDVKFPTEPIDGIYYDDRIVNVHSRVLHTIPDIKWPDDHYSDSLGMGFAFKIGTEAIIVNSEE